MNMMLVLFAMPLLCAGLGLYAAARNRAEERRKPVARTGRGNGGLVLPRNWHRVLPLCLIVCAACAFLSAGAQEIIHARAGEVVAADGKTLTLKAADGSTVMFQDVANPAPALTFNKDVRSKTVPAATFNKVGAHVVVFFYGYGTLTAVAARDLGADAPARSVGNVANFDRHQHVLMVKTDAAAPQKLVLSDDTIVDTTEGVVKSADFHPSKGESVRCFATPASQAALFVAAN